MMILAFTHHSQKISGEAAKKFIMIEKS